MKTKSVSLKAMTPNEKLCNNYKLNRDSFFNFFIVNEKKIIFLINNLHHQLNKMDEDLTEVFKTLFLEENKVILTVQ